MVSGCKSVHRFAQISLTLALSTLSLPSSAAPEDCLEMGGQATCKAPILVTTPWQYALCDDASSSLGRAAAWCAVMGGSWSGSGCAGATPPSESTVYPLADAFERSIHSPCPVSGTDNGWLAPGGFLDSWNCWRGGPRYQYGIEIFNLREMPFSGQAYDINTKTCRNNWNERVIALRTRSVATGCPDDYTLRVSRFTGALECYKLETCPVKPLTPYTPDPYPLNINDLTQRMKDGLECLKRCTGESNVSALLDSAYRPYSYQLHLREVYLKWKELEHNTKPACAALKAEVKAEFDRHRLGRSTLRPSANPNNCHSLGDCVDLNSPYTEAVDFCSLTCRVYRPWPDQDPNHVVSY